ncbi:MAG TPA: ECF transporter S component [Streptosporangiaceae bacterium]|nr:ECF transporter S component [Streptosporangiaceae bacterium]
MGTAAMVYANSTIRLSPGWNAFYYWLIWAVCITGTGIVAWAALKSRRWARWTTQDILIVAALGVLLEVYDNIIGDQFIKPLLNPIPGTEFLQLHDLPYMFLLMVGVALVRKPGCVTAMVFVNFLLAQLLFGSGHGMLDWTDGLTQGIFCDLYIVARLGRVYAPGASRLSMVIDGLVIGILRGAPNAFFTDWSFDPYLNATFYTWLQMWNDTWSNGLFNGIEAAISAVAAHRVAVSVVPSLGASRARAGAAVDPFAEPQDAKAGAATSQAGPTAQGPQPSEGGAA